MGGVGERDFVLLKNLKVELRSGDGVEEVNEGFTLCFWLYIDSCASFPSAILVQKHPDVTSSVPFLWLDDAKKLKLSPLLFLHEEAPDQGNSSPWTTIPSASTETEFQEKKWVHVGCEVLCNCVRLHVDGEVVGEKPLTCSFNKDLHSDALKGLYLACPDENEEIFCGYVHDLDVQFQTSSVKDHHSKLAPVQLSIDSSSASEIEEDSDGVWSIVGGKASCRRIFSLDVALLDAYGCPVDRDVEVVASLLYADNEAVVEDTTDAEPPLLTSYDGVEYGSHARPCKLINGRASFKLKISQLSSKCDNRLFLIRFNIPKIGRYPFLEAYSMPIRCVSRNRNTRPASMPWRKSSNRNYYINRCESPSLEDGSVELIPNIVREAKPSPSSKRIKLGNDTPIAVYKEELKQTNRGRNEDKGHASSMNNGSENHYNSSASKNYGSSIFVPKSMLTDSNPIPDSIIFKYCLGSLAERCRMLKEIAMSASEEHIESFAKQVSTYTGCLHHWQQIKISKRLVEDGIQVWTSEVENLPWENLVYRINEQFMKISCCRRPLTNQDFECLRKIAGCRDSVSQEDFERIWSWLYPVAFALSQSAISSMWNSLSPVWIEGFITKEEAESALQGSGQGGLQDPGTFVLRFPTSRSWPHPDAGSLVVTYVGGDYAVHHRLLSLDFSNSCSSNEIMAKPLPELLLEEPELSQLGRSIRSH